MFISLSKHQTWKGESIYIYFFIIITSQKTYELLYSLRASQENIVLHFLISKPSGTRKREWSGEGQAALTGCLDDVLCPSKSLLRGHQDDLITRWTLHPLLFQKYRLNLCHILFPVTAQCPWGWVGDIYLSELSGEEVLSAAPGTAGCKHWPITMSRGAARKLAEDLDSPCCLDSSFIHFILSMHLSLQPNYFRCPIKYALIHSTWYYTAIRRLHTRGPSVYYIA